jgi:hypothetical protein
VSEFALFVAARRPPGTRKTRQAIFLEIDIAQASAFDIFRAPFPMIWEASYFN